MDQEGYAKAVREAAAALGGEEALAKQLGVPRTEVQLWVEGKSVPPLRQFFIALLLAREQPLKPPRSE